MKRIAILGSTGSVGESTLDVIRRNPERFEVVALTAHRRVDALVAQCHEFRPALAVVADPGQASNLASGVADLNVETAAGPEALEDAASLPEADAVMAAIVGGAGLRPAMAAARTGKQILLANKEALVMSGSLFVEACRASGADVLPIDSEHNAIFQCLSPGSKLGERPAGVSKIVLTASGGPFLSWSAESMATATPDQACAHPRWEMGRKISVDSATLMNKGLEIIEAMWLFGLPLGDIEVVVHPQSVIHSLVQYRDGSMLAQLGEPDMRIPIAHALGWPQRVESGVDGARLAEIGKLQFEPPDPARFPALRLAKEAAQAGQASTIALNAANEVAVGRFLGEQLEFGEIMKLVAEIVDQMDEMPIRSLEDVVEFDQETRDRAVAWSPAGKALT